VPLDYSEIISDEAARILANYECDRAARVPWSDRWTVGTVARHVAGTHHVVAGVIRDRPDADFGLFNDLVTPPKDSPEFAPWFQAGTASLLGQLSTVPPQEECWTWYADGGRVGWWARRLAHEAVVHRADTDLARGQEFSVAPEIAADGIDEYLDVFVTASRTGHDAPAGPTIGFECSDTGDQWWLDLSVRGARTVTREPLVASTRISGTASDLLLAVWGRVPIDDAGRVETSGDLTVLGRWAELVPPV